MIQDIRKVLDYETVNAVVIAKTTNGIKLIKTKIDIFYNPETGVLDDDIFEMIEDEPCYRWDGENNFIPSKAKLIKILDLLDWRL